MILLFVVDGEWGKRKDDPQLTGALFELLRDVGGRLDPPGAVHPRNDMRQPDAPNCLDQNL